MKDLAKRLDMGEESDMRSDGTRHRYEGPVNPHLAGDGGSR